MTGASSEPTGHTDDPGSAIAHALESSSARRFRVGLALGALVAVAITLLIAQNGESAKLDWLAFHFESPLWIMLMLTLVSGGIVWEVLKALWRRSRRSRGERRAVLRAAKKMSS